MPRLLVKLGRDRNKCGSIAVERDDGTLICGPFTAGGRSSDLLATSKGNPSRNQLLPYGDTPLGVYLIRGLVRTGSGTPFFVRDFGPTGILTLEGVSGNAALAEANGRFAIPISGGDLCHLGQLRSTSGGLRLNNTDMAELVKCLRKITVVRAEVIEQRIRGDADGVTDDPDWQWEDQALLGPTAPVIPIGAKQPLQPTARSLKGALALAFSVTFVQAGSTASSAAIDSVITTRRRPANQDITFRASEVATVPVVQVAYNGAPTETTFDRQQSTGVDQVVQDVVEGETGSESLAARIHEQMDKAHEYLEDPKHSFFKDLGDFGNEKLESLAESAAKAAEEARGVNDEKGLWSNVAQFVEETDTEFRVSAAEPVAPMLSAVSKASSAIDYANQTYTLEEAIRDYHNDKIDALKLIEKVGPLPAKALATYYKIPFGGTMVDMTVKGGQSAVGKMVDWGWDTWDEYKYGVKPQKP